MNDSEVIVIGAGIAGLVAAFQLKKRGHNVLLLESSSKVGGRMVTDFPKKFIIDEGAQFLSSAYPILSGLIKELGLNSEYVETSTLVGVVRNGTIRKFKYNKPFSLLTGGLLGMGEWVSLGMGSLKLLKQTKDTPINDYSAWNEYDTETIENWSNQYYGEKVTDYFIEPMLEAFYFQKPEDTSKALSIALNAFSAHKAKTMTLTNGIGSLPSRLGEKLNIEFNTPVDKINCNDNEVFVYSKEKRFKTNNVILATPAHISKTIYKPKNITESLLLDTEYSCTINITIALRKKLSNVEGIYGIWIPRKERKNIAAIAIETEKHSARTHTGELLNVMLAGESGKMMINKGSKEILEAVLKELENYFPNISDEITFSKVYRWQHAEPMSPVGRSKNIRKYRDTLQDTLQKGNKVILAGDFMGMPFTEGAAETGAWAASKLLATKYHK